VSITNLGSRVREIELIPTPKSCWPRTPPTMRTRHSQSCFVETRSLADTGAILATRRLRSPGDPQAWAAHLAVVEGETIGDVQFETDRMRFLGRTRDSDAACHGPGSPLSNTVGAVLDPIFSLRVHVRVPPQTTARIAFWTLIAPPATQRLVL